MRHKRFFSFLASLFAFHCALAQLPNDEQRRASFSKPSVVRIVDGVSCTFRFDWPERGISKTYPVSSVSSGTGFFVNPEGYIATNAHVVSTGWAFHQGSQAEVVAALKEEYIRAVAKDIGIEASAVNDEVRNGILSLTTVVEQPKPIQGVLVPGKRHLPFTIVTFGAPVGQGKDVAIIKVDVQNAPSLLMGDAEKILLQEHITVIGFPAAADTDVLDAQSVIEPSITDGKVSAKKNMEDGSPVIQISAPATHGNSGGPVINDRGEVVGMLTFRGDTVEGQEVTGFTFVVPTSTIAEFLQSSGVTNTTGTTGAIFKEGLELYWNEHYAEAAKKFEEVERLYPYHLDAPKFRQACSQAVAAGKDKPLDASGGSGSSSLWIYLAVGGGLVLVLAVVFLLIAAAGRNKVKDPRISAYDGNAYPDYPLPPSYEAPPEQYPAAPYPEAANVQPSFPAQSPSYYPVPPAPDYPPPPPAPQAYPPAAAPPPPPYPAYSPSARPTVLDIAPDAAGYGKTIVVNPAQMVPKEIVFTTGPLTGQHFPLTAEGSWIGRDRNSALIVIPDGRISKRHAWIGLHGNEAVLEDPGSTNGTFLENLGTPRVTRTVLRTGMTVVLSEADVARFVVG